MEVERPQGYIEYISGDDSWNAIGMRIKWTRPVIPEKETVSMLDPLTIRLCVECKKPVPLRDLSAWCWTCFYHKDNIEGIYREIRLIYDETSRKWDDWGTTTYEFEATVYPTHIDTFRLTYNVKFKNYMIWSNLRRIDHMLTVSKPKDVNKWTKSAQFAKITHNIHIGNYLTVLLAEEMYFDSILKLQAGIADDLNISKLIKRVKSDTLPQGAGLEIPPDKIQGIVYWLQTASKESTKTLVGDKEGLGRAGSALTAYIFANNPNLTFEEAYKFVQDRKFIYCHKGLNATLNRLFPRD